MKARDDIDGMRRSWLRYGVFAILVGLPLAVEAAPTLPSSPTGALHVGKKALDLVGAMALKKLPAQIALPAIDKAIVSCPVGDPVTLHVQSAYVNLDPSALQFQPGDGELGISALLNIDGYAHVILSKGYGCIGDAECDVTFAVQQLNPQASVSVSIDNGQPNVSIGAVSVTVPPGDLQVNFSNCAFDGLYSDVATATGSALLELAQGPIGDQVRAQVPPLVESKLATMLSYSGSVAGYGFSAQLTDLDMTADGVDAYAKIGVSYDGAPAACLAPGTATMTSSSHTDATLSLPTGPTSPVVIGVSTDLLSSALAAAWQAGMLCADDSLIRKLGFDPDQLAALVPGIPEGISLHFAMVLDTPPTVEDDGQGGMRMRVTGAELLLSMTAPGQPTSGAAIVSDFTVGVLPSVDASTGSIYAALTDLSMQRMELHAGASGTTFTLDPERLTVMLADVVMPMAAARLQGMPLSPAAFGADGMYAWLDNVSLRDGGVYVGLEPFVPSTDGDTQPPQTLLQKTPGPLVRAGMAKYELDGTDDQTPSQLLRFEWQIDSQPVVASGFSRVVSAPVTTSGTHTFRVHAIDLAGNGDPNWLTDTFELDPTPPTLQVLSAPDVILSASSAHIRITGTDDRSPVSALSFAYRVATRQPGGELKDVSTVAPARFKDGVGDIEVGNLHAGSTYEVTVMVYDEAGNVTSSPVTFGTADSSGCSLAPHAASPSVACVVLALMALIVIRRRGLVLG